MKTEALTTVKLAIIYFFLWLAANICLTVPQFLPSDNYEKMMDLVHPLAFVCTLVPPIVMTLVVLADMLKQHRVDWTLLVIIFCSGGMGAALYPMWDKVIANGKEIKNMLAIMAILIAARYFFQQFAVRNDWASYLGWGINLVAAIFAVQFLKMMNCKSTVVWIAALMLTFLQVNLGLPMILLLLALYGSQHPGKSPINKYLILLALSGIYGNIIRVFPCVELMNYSRALFEVVGLIPSIINIVIFVLLIIDAIKQPIKGKVWRLLPALMSLCYSVIAIQINEEDTRSEVNQQYLP